MKRSILILLAVSAFISCKQDQKKTYKNVQITDSLTVQIHKIYEVGHINGLAVAIVDDKRTLYAEGFGYANKEKKFRILQKRSKT